MNNGAVGTGALRSLGSPRSGRNRVAFEAARLRLARLRQDGDEARWSTVRRAVEISARTLGVERVSVWMLHDEGRALDCVDLYTRSRSSHGTGPRLLASEYPIYFAALGERRALAHTDARTDPTTRELATPYLVPLGITSVLDAPIIREGQVVGVVCHEHVGAPREWSQDDMAFASSVADIITTMFEQTERLELEAQARHDTYCRGLQTKMEALGRLASAVAHDFNNVLATVTLLAEEITGHADPKVADAASDIRGSVDIATRLVRQLLAFGRERPVEPKLVSIGELLEGLRPMLATGVGPSVVLEVLVSAAHPTMTVDASLIEQIVLNLCFNARDALDGRSGHVQVRLRDPLAADELDDGYLVLEVSDDGCGMDEATQEHIFEPYFTTREAGTGLGLATVYSIVQKLDGLMVVASAPGRGTTFTIALPRAADQ